MVHNCAAFELVSNAAGSTSVQYVFHRNMRTQRIPRMPSRIVIFPLIVDLFDLNQSEDDVRFHYV